MSNVKITVETETEKQEAHKGGTGTQEKTSWRTIYDTLWDDRVTWKGSGFEGL